MRLLFLVDVQNLFYSVRDTYGVDARIDFKLLREEAICNRSFTSVRCVAYLTHFKERDDIEGLKKALVLLSYETRIGKIRRTESGLAGTDMDVELATEAIDKADEYDVIVVASGDGDLIPAYKILKGRGKRVEVIAFSGSLGRSIGEEVDEVKYLGKGVLYVPREKGISGDGKKTQTE